MKWLKFIFNWIAERFFTMILPTTHDGFVDTTKVILAVVYEFNGRKVFRISMFDQGVLSDHWVEWSQQLENWLMMSGVNVTESISVEKDYIITEEKIHNIPIDIANKTKIRIK